MMSSGSHPCERRKLLISPAPPRICWNTATTITQDRKWGRYRIDCTHWRTRLDTRLCSSSARMIGAGKTKTVCSSVMISVLRSAARNSGSPENRIWKFSNPTQRLRSTPRYGW